MVHEDVQEAGSREHWLQRKDLQRVLPWGSTIRRHIEESYAGLDAELFVSQELLCRLVEHGTVGGASRI